MTVNRTDSLDRATVPDSDTLAYTVEIGIPFQSGGERVIARTASIALAQAVFAEAQREFAGKLVRMRCGDRLIAETLARGGRSGPAGAA